ncbi:hypothetical protein Scep_000643 [Stephania cephalantha]|uniref:Omega-hydroxypalmitate O-feruloyl transferase n=1 Tax=Stephania cephalantha TaxID=152367 RepID=A0AAP0L811_9MAGN
MHRSRDLPDCYYHNAPTLIPPETPTPHHSLYLSNLDDQKFLRFSIKYVYVYKRCVSAEKLRSSLSKALVHYYPLAGRLKVSEEKEGKLEVECNGEGALFVEAFMDFTADEVLEASRWPNVSWRKLLYRVDAQSFLGVPPLIVQVTKLRCGGMILCTGINHCLCDGIGSSQFLHAWAHLTTKPDQDLPLHPIHARHVLIPRNPPITDFPHPQYTAPNEAFDLNMILRSQPLIPVSLTFTASDILHLKQLCVPSLKCTSFEALAAHTWRCWVRSLGPPSSMKIRLLFSANIRKLMDRKIAEGYYGNGFVLACAESRADELVDANVQHGVRLVQKAKEALSEEYVRSMVDYLEENRARPDLTATLVISQWARLGLEEVDFGVGRAVYVGPLLSEIYCIFVPVVGDVEAQRVIVSMPESVAGKFVYYMKDYFVGM